MRKWDEMPSLVYNRAEGICRSPMGETSAAINGFDEEENGESKRSTLGSKCHLIDSFQKVKIM